MHRRVIGLVSILLAALSHVSLAQSSSGSAPTITQAQVAAGRAAYRQSCAVCHGQRLEGLQISPGLAGDRFDRTWRGKPASLLAFHLHRMPQAPAGEPGSLSEETYTNLLAYILQSNGLEAGETALPSALDALAKLVIPKKEGVEVDLDAPVAGAAEKSEALKKLSPVTDEMLKNPSPGNWLQWGRTYDGQNYSPLTLINRDNVKELKSAWRTPLKGGMSMPMPLVHDGIMFLLTFPDTVLALDASNGTVLWRHQSEVTTGSSQKMGLALHGDKVLVPTSDLHVLALSAKTGEVIWNHEIATEVKSGGRGSYQIRSAPLVVGNKVIQGVTASFVPRGGFIVALDIDSGKEAWRFNTIARPGEPGGDTWNDLPLDKRSGGSVWHQGTYDPELNLLYFGVAPTYDTGPMLHSVDHAGVTNDALFTDCTIALDPDTGKLVWHYQHQANNQWDLDWVFERQIANMPVNGETRKVVMTTGKMGILEGLDAATGAYLFSIDSGVQNVITKINPKTGAKTIDPEKMPDPDRPCVICPIADGARSWPQTSYSPRTNFVYVPLTEWCMTFGVEGVKLLTSGVGITSTPHPATSDGMMGRLQAIDLTKRTLGWTHDLEAPLTTAALSTAGGVVFTGDLDPSLKAFDDTTGELLWQSKLDDLPSSSLVTYTIGETQYVAVVVGLSNFHVRDYARTYAEFRAKLGKPADNLPKGGAAIWVFAL
jgi:alcohol dehydrogenase (cytochrome c)